MPLAARPKIPHAAHLTGRQVQTRRLDDQIGDRLVVDGHIGLAGLAGAGQRGGDLGRARLQCAGEAALGHDGGRIGTDQHGRAGLVDAIALGREHVDTHRQGLTGRQVAAGRLDHDLAVDRPAGREHLDHGVDQSVAIGEGHGRCPGRDAHQRLRLGNVPHDAGDRRGDAALAAQVDRAAQHRHVGSDANALAHAHADHLGI